MIETVKVEYDPDIVSLKDILNQFFKVIDATSLNRQGPDEGSQYRSGVYYINDEDLEIILDVINNEQLKYENPIVTEVERLEKFYLAEEYHQKYLKKNPNGYCHINLYNI